MSEESAVRSYRPFLFGSVTFVLLLVVTQLIAYQRYQIIKKTEQDALQQELDNTVSRFREILNHKISSANTLVIIYGQNRRIDDFDSIARQVIAYDSSIDMLNYTEGYTIKQVYPMAGNAMIVGRSLLEVPLFKKEIALAVKNRKLLFAGPYPLTNNRGTGIACRIPVYIKDSFCGIVSVITKLPTIIAQLPQLKNNNGEFVFRLSKVNPVTGKTENYFEGYQPKDHYEVSAYMPEGNWVLYAAYSAAYSTPKDAMVIAIIGVLLSVMVGVFVYSSAKLPLKLENTVRQRTHELGERVKELTTIYAVNQVLKDNTLPADTVFSRIVKILPPGWQYPEDCAAKISFDGSDYATDNYAASPCKQTAAFELVDGRKGEIEVVYAKEKPREYDGCFLKEERDLIDSIADTIAVYFNKAAQQGILRESESKFRGAFENAAIGMALVSLEGKWMQVNKALCDMLGYSAEELMAMSFQQLTPPEDLAKDMEFVHSLTKGNRDFYRREKKYVHKNGSLIWVNLNVAVVRDSAGKPIYFVSQIENITEKKSITEQLKENEHKLRLFVEHSPASLAMFDMDMKYILTSKRWITDYKLEGKEIIGKSHYEVFPTVPQRWKEIHQRCLAGASEKNDEDSFIGEDGKLAWLYWEIHPWYKASGEVGGIIMFTEVITDRVETKMKFQNLVERSLVGVYIVQDGRFVYVNPKMVEESGYTEEELIGMRVDELIYEEDIPVLQRNMTERLDGNVASARYEIRARVKTGAIVWLELFGTGTFYQGSKAIIGTMVNIMDKKSAYLELEKTTANLKSIFDTTHVSYLLLDRAYNVVSYNSIFKNNYKELTGHDIIVGEHFPSIALPGRRDPLLEKFDEVVEKRVPIDYEVTYNQFEKPKHLLVQQSPVISNNEVIGICLASMDVTQRKNMELERQEIINDLVQRNRDLEQFAHILSHNVRAPLSTILGLSSFIKEQQSDKDRAITIEGIEHSAIQLDVVIKDLNDILHIKRDISELKTKIKLSEVVEEVKHMLAMPITTNDAVIETDFSSADEIDSVHSYIHSIFYNLLSNAIKYRQKDVAPRISITTVKKEDKIFISVKDNGVGIDMTRHGNQLFGLYKRFHPEVEGKGMGLFMVKTQVDALQGDVYVQSDLGKGTEFVIRFNA